MLEMVLPIIYGVDLRLITVHPMPTMGVKEAQMETTILIQL